MDIMKCPYCDGFHEIKIIAISDEFPKQYFIECPKCHTQTGQHDTEMEAIAAWFGKIIT